MTFSVKKPRKKKCKCCGEAFQPERNFQPACSIPCALKLGRENVVTEKKAKIKKEKREFNEKNKSLTVIKKEAQQAFNEFIRYRDLAAGVKECMSCERPLDWIGRSMVNAGHYRSVGSSVHMRFVEANVHAQCAYCNGQLSGNVTEYRKGLIKKIGLEAVEALEADNEQRNYRRADYERIRDEYRAKTKEIKGKLK